MKQIEANQLLVEIYNDDKKNGILKPQSRVRLKNYFAPTKKTNAATKLYYHKTSGGAEYLTDQFILCDNGHKQGDLVNSKYIVRIDGDIKRDAEIFMR